jgi:hypothetical protein
MRKFVASMGFCRFCVCLLILWRFADSMRFVGSMRGFVDSMRFGRFCEWVLRFCGVCKFYKWVCRFYGGLQIL